MKMSRKLSEVEAMSGSGFGGELEGSWKRVVEGGMSSLNYFCLKKVCIRMDDTKSDGLLGGVWWRKGSLNFYFSCKSVFEVYDTKIDALFKFILG